MRTPPKARARASGRFILRIEPSLHTALRSAAKSAQLSLNEYCARKLAAPVGFMGELQPAASLLARAVELLGAELVGVVLFGSWARGEARPSSDVDALIVVDSRKALTRELYRIWDEQTLSWDGHSVEPHFVHLPDLSAVGTVWAEAAMDGIILFERELAVSRGLAAIRHQIVAGRLVRRVIHGQPYWAEVA